MRVKQFVFCVAWILLKGQKTLKEQLYGTKNTGPYYRIVIMKWL